VLTGSQQWQAMRSLPESLAGRAAFLDLEGFSLQELEGRWNLPGWLQTWLETPEELTAGRGPRDAGSGKSPLEWLWRGQPPGVQPLAADLVTDFRTGYQRTYIERDGVLYPFEIKLTAQPTRRDASSTTAFREAHPSLKIGKGAILCAAERPLWMAEDVAAIPWNQA
jgi:hypothetical protein